MWVLSLLALALQIASQPIENFGLITVTHSRNGDFSVIEKYLERYTETECYTEFISEINLIWNNEEAPQQTSILKRQKYWKIPVYFFRTTFNSMDHRYRLPKESTAQLLYSLDDDIIVDCETFKLTLDRFNEVNKHQLGAVTTNEVRGYAFDPNKGVEFLYQGHAAALYFSIAEPGAAFIPRHFLQLYYLKLDELVYMRNIVLDVKNCDDIFFWAIVQHFYPELPGIYVKGQSNYRNTDPKVGQSKTKNVYPIRNNCLNNISDALGYNSLRLFKKNSTKYLSNWQYPNLGLILGQRMAGLADVLMIPGEQKAANPSKQAQNSSPLATVQPSKKTETPEMQHPVQPSPVPQEISKTQQPRKQASQNIQPKEQKIADKPVVVDKQVAVDKPVVTDKPVESKAENPTPIKPNVEQTYKSQEKQVIIPDPVILINEESFFSHKILLLVIAIVILIVILYKLYKRHQQAAKLYAQRLSDIDEEQQMYSSSIRLPDHY